MLSTAALNCDHSAGILVHCLHRHKKEKYYADECFGAWGLRYIAASFILVVLKKTVFLMRCDGGN
jgi:hypothetical protein